MKQTIPEFINQRTPNSRKGSINIVPINLKTTSSVNPIILNGNSSNQSTGSKNSSTNANGQQSTSKMHQRIMAMNVFIIGN